MHSSDAIHDNAPDVLKRILAHKLEEVAAARADTDLAAMRARAERADAPRGFRESLLRHAQGGRAGVIAEIKKASPSKGIIRADFHPREIAESYARAGASALSVLTDESFFHGRADYLTAAREASGLAALRKDFMLDPYQIYEARALGADCVLLVVAALADAGLVELQDVAVSLGMDVLVEVHDRSELDRALALEPTLLGVNNRDLRTFETSLDTTIGLLEHIPATCTVVTESAIHTRADVALMRANGVQHFLVGEAFMRAPDPGAKLRELFEL